MLTRTLVPTLLIALACSACQKKEPVATAPVKPAQVDATRIVQADQDPGNWLTHGRTYSEQRFSPLAKIDAGNVKQLGLAWFVDLDTHRGQEATPLIIDGVLYSTSAWSKVQAIDAASGKLLWQYDPKVPGETGVKACCDTVNRGVAAYEGKLFLGTLDGRLVALDAATGNEVWSVVTVDQTKAYTITGAPRVIKGKVIIGNGGAEFGVRGYISAYDAQTRQDAVALLHRARRSLEAVRSADSRAGREDVARRMVEARRRRHGLGFDGVRPRARPALHRHRQRLAVEPAVPQPRRRRQPVPQRDRRAEAGHRRVRVALPVDAGRDVGLHGDPAHRARRPDHRRSAAQGADAGAEERLLLCRRSHQRSADFREAVRAGELGERDRPEDGPAGRELRWRAS